MTDCEEPVDDTMDDVTMDWALGEVLGEIKPPDLTADVRRRLAATAVNSPPPEARPNRLLVAAALLLGTLVVAAVTWARRDRPAAVPPAAAPTAQEPAGAVVVTSREQIEALPADTRSVVGNGLQDDDVPALLRLQHLDSLELRAILPSPLSPSQPAEPTGTLGDAGLGLLTSLQNLRALRLRFQAALTARGFANLRLLRNLEQLEIEGIRCDDAMLEVLPQLPKLEQLAILGCTGVGEPTIERIGGMRRLRSLSLRNCWTVDPGWLAHLAPAKQLERLDLGGLGTVDLLGANLPKTRQIAGADLAFLAGFDRLTDLTLAGSAILAAGLDALATLPLRRLDISNCTINHEMIAAIRRMERLEELVITSGTFGMPPEPLAALRRLPQVRRLVVDGRVEMLPAAPERAQVGSREEIEALPADTRHVVGQRLDDAAVAALQRLPRLEVLELHAELVFSPTGGAVGTISDDGMRALAALTELRELRLKNQTAITAAGFAALADLVALERLEIAVSGIDDGGVAVVARLPRLRSLELSNCYSIGAAALRSIATMPALRDLDLDQCAAIESEWLLPLGELQQLEHLSLNMVGSLSIEVGVPPLQQSDPPAVTDDVLRAIARIPGLRSLELEFAAITRDGLKALQTSPLKLLDLSNTDLPHEAIDDLPATLESLTIRGWKPLTEARMAQIRSLPHLRRLVTGAVTHLLR